MTENEQLMKNNRTNFLQKRETKHAQRILFILTVLFFFLADISADELVTTKSGRRVVIKDNGTWIYADSRDSASVSPLQENISKPDVSSPGRNNDLPATGPQEEVKADKSIIRMALAAIVLLVAVIAFVVSYFTLIQPAKKRKKLFSALEIIQSGQVDMYGEAEKLLNEVVSSGVKANDLKEAYFARAFIRAKMENYTGCASDLESADPDDPGVIYLTLWVNLKLEKLKQTFDLFEKHENLLLKMPEAKKIMSVACYKIGKEHWDKREIEESIPYFERIRKLEVFADKVPESISDHEITLGILELFDNRYAEADKHFDGAIFHAEKNNKSTVYGQIGKILCRWCTGEQANLDKELTQLVTGLEKITKSELLLLRNVLLLHGVSLLHYWYATHDAGKNLLENEREELDNRLKKVIAADGKMPDPKLILGLIDYWFFNENRKTNAIAMLEESGTTIPEVARIIALEKANEELILRKLDNFLAIVKEYLNNNEVPQMMKDALLDKLERFNKFKDKGISVNQEKTDTEGATIASLQSRQAILRKKMKRIVEGIYDENKEKAKELDSLMNNITESSRSIQEHAEKLEKSEQELLVNTGEFLLRDEEE